MAAPDTSGLTPEIVTQNFLDMANIDIEKGMTLKESIDGFYALCPPLRTNIHFKQTYPACFVEVLRRKQEQQGRLVDVTDVEQAQIAGVPAQATGTETETPEVPADDGAHTSSTPE